MPDPLDTSCLTEDNEQSRQQHIEEDVEPFVWPLATDSASKFTNKLRRSSQPDIFERCLSTLSFGSPSRRNSRVSMCTALHKLNNARLSSVASTDSQRSIALHHSTEDFIPPVLDHSAEILTNPQIDFSEVSVVCCDCDGEGKKLKHSEKSECSNRSGEKKTALRPRQRSRSRSRSFICNSLLKALALEEDEEETDVREEDAESVEECSPDSETINFYSFNDILNREKDLEKFNTFRMSKLLS